MHDNDADGEPLSDGLHALHSQGQLCSMLGTWR